MQPLVYYVSITTNKKKIHYSAASVVDIVTGYGPDGPGNESQWGRDFPHLSRPALGSTQPLVQWVPGLSHGKEQLGHDADPSPPSSVMVMKGYSYTSTPPIGCMACTEPQCLYKGALFTCTTVQVAIQKFFHG
jgi:hypothetical protein